MSKKFEMGGWLTWLIGSLLPIFMVVTAFTPYGALETPWNFVMGIPFICITLLMWWQSRKLWKISQSLDDDRI